MALLCFLCATTSQRQWQQALRRQLYATKTAASYIARSDSMINKAGKNKKFERSGWRPKIYLWTPRAHIGIRSNCFLPAPERNSPLTASNGCLGNLIRLSSSIGSHVCLGHTVSRLALVEAPSAGPGVICGYSRRTYETDGDLSKSMRPFISVY